MIQREIAVVLFIAGHLVLLYSNTCCQHLQKARLRQFIVEMGKGVGIFMDTVP